jgi:hypothetical protein
MPLVWSGLSRSSGHQESSDRPQRLSLDSTHAPLVAPLVGSAPEAHGEQHGKRRRRASGAPGSASPPRAAARAALPRSSPVTPQPHTR